MSRNEAENLKARAEAGATQQEGRPSPIDPYLREKTIGPATEVPAKEILMSWIEDRERELINQLTALQRVKDRVRYTDEYTCQIVRDLVKFDIRRSL